MLDQFFPLLLITLDPLADANLDLSSKYASEPLRQINLPILEVVPVDRNVPQILLSQL